MKHVSGKRLAQIAADKGWIFISQGGSHTKYRDPLTGRSIIIPIHGNRDLKAGLQHHLMRVLEITDADL